MKGAFPETARALERTSPIIAQGRPYTPDLIGWFDDFSTSGPTDAAAGVSRALVVFNLFDLTGQVPGALHLPGIGPAIIPLNERTTALSKTARIGQFKKCPGGAEQAAVDASNVWSAADQHALDCKESARATGPIK